ncbi:hypothetical protein ERJ75_001273800 [Trypanosoma vivax]|nr:hypothetical protein ERJ75_001273800 [Trypanosoma vivax]
MKADSSEKNKPTKCLAQAMIFLCNNAHSTRTKGAVRTAPAMARARAQATPHTLNWSLARATKASAFKVAAQQRSPLRKRRGKRSGSSAAHGHSQRTHRKDQQRATPCWTHSPQWRTHCTQWEARKTASANWVKRNATTQTTTTDKRASASAKTLKQSSGSLRRAQIADKLQLQTNMAQQARWEGAQIRHEAASEARRLTLDDGTQQGTTEGNATSGNDSTATDKTSSASRKTASTGHGPKGTNTQSSTEPGIATGTPLANTCRDDNQRWDPEKQQCTDNAQAAYQGLMATAAAWTLLARRLAA